MQHLRRAGLRLLAQQAGSSPGPLAGPDCPPPAARRLRRAAEAAQSPASSPTRLPMHRQSLNMLWQKLTASQQRGEVWPGTTQLQQAQDASSMSANIAHSGRFCMCSGHGSNQRVACEHLHRSRTTGAGAARGWAGHGLCPRRAACLQGAPALASPWTPAQAPCTRPGPGRLSARRHAPHPRRPICATACLVGQTLLTGHTWPPAITASVGFQQTHMPQAAVGVSGMPGVSRLLHCTASQGYSNWSPMSCSFCNA